MDISAVLRAVLAEFIVRVRNAGAGLRKNHIIGVIGKRKPYMPNFQIKGKKLVISISEPLFGVISAIEYTLQILPVVKIAFHIQMIGTGLQAGTHTGYDT